MRSGPFWTRLAAASGVGFAAAAVAAYVLQANNDFANAGALASEASDDLWATWVLLVGLAGVLLLWFTSASHARMRDIEGGSRRVASAHFGAGTVIGAALFVEVAVQFAARGAETASGLEALAASIVGGPALAFAAGVYVVAAGVVGTRAGTSLPMLSGVLARLSVLLGIALIAGGGLWLYRDYAWLNDTAFFAVIGWVFVLSLIGIFRWGDLDAEGLPFSIAPATRQPAAARARKAAPPLVEDIDEEFEIPPLTRRSRPARTRATRASASPARKARRKPARKTTARKPAATERKPAATERKPAAPERKPAAKRAPRKSGPRPTPPPPSAEEVSETEALEALDLEERREEDET